MGNWTDPNIVEVQSTPDESNGVRGVTVSGVGSKKTTKHRHQPLSEEELQHHQLLIAASSAAAAQAVATITGEEQQQPVNEIQSYETNMLRPPTTKLGKARMRMKWSPEVNMFIMKSYYQLTNLETNMKHYRDNLQKVFNEEYQVNVCAQRIADQRRAIVKNRLLPPETVERIRNEVAESLLPKRYIVVKTESPPPSTFNPNIIQISTTKESLS